MNNAKNKLILLRGLPGSGKSTFAEFLATFLADTYVHVKEFSTDSYFVNDAGEYEFDLKHLGRNHERCRLAVRMFFTDATLDSNRMHIAIVHNTSTTESEVNVYKKIANDFNVQFVSLIVENRHGNVNVHNVPDEAIERMANRFSVFL